MVKKPFKIVDNSNKYCCMFDLYTGKDLMKPYMSSPFGKTDDSVMRLMNDYL